MSICKVIFLFFPEKNFIFQILIVQNENRINFVKIDKFLVVSQIKNNDKNEEIGNLVEEKESQISFIFYFEF